MCGLAGIFSHDGRPIDRAALERMNQVQYHRVLCLQVRLAHPLYWIRQLIYLDQ